MLALPRPRSELQAVRQAAQLQSRITTVLDFALQTVKAEDNTSRTGVQEMALGELKRE